MKPKPHEFENENANAMITKEDWVEHPVVSESLHRLLNWIGHGVSLFLFKGHFNSNKIIMTDTHAMLAKSEKSQKPKLILISVQKDLIPMHSIKSKLT